MLSAGASITSRGEDGAHLEAEGEQGLMSFSGTGGPGSAMRGGRRAVSSIWTGNRESDGVNSSVGGE